LGCSERFIRRLVVESQRVVYESVS
jgi:hypothetical protein